MTFYDFISQKQKIVKFNFNLMDNQLIKMTQCDALKFDHYFIIPQTVFFLHFRGNNYNQHS